MPSITDMINEKYGVTGGNIADALSQAAGYEPGQGIDNIADAINAAYEYQNTLATFDVTFGLIQDTSAMPTEETAANSTSIFGNVADNLKKNYISMVFAINSSDELDDADHGEVWGVHKWAGIEVITGLEDITGIRFTDDTGASCVLGEGDIAEATGLGCDNGSFVLYFKAEDPKYLTGEKYFYLEKNGYKRTKVTMKVSFDPTYR